jgi:hypothetical protein
MANVYVHDHYVERIDRLALGIQPLDAGSAGRVARTVRVQLEDTPEPFIVKPRRFGRCVYDAGLPDIDRHATSRYTVLYRDDPTRQTIPITIRLFDCHRWFVPRRLRMKILTLEQLLNAEASAGGPAFLPVLRPPQPPVSARVRKPVLFPGAAYQTDASVTGLRGRVVRAGKPMRWARVEARESASGTLLGRAHGDDRGEFFLILGSVATPGAVSRLVVPVTVAVRVFGPAQPPVPGASDPDRLDPLWDLPIEETPIPDDPDPVSTGEQLPPGYRASTAGPPQVDLPVGRVTSRLSPFMFV